MMASTLRTKTLRIHRLAARHNFPLMTVSRYITIFCAITIILMLIVPLVPNRSIIATSFQAIAGSPDPGSQSGANSAMLPLKLAPMIAADRLSRKAAGAPFLSSAEPNYTAKLRIISQENISAKGAQADKRVPDTPNVSNIPVIAEASGLSVAINNRIQLTTALRPRAIVPSKADRLPETVIPAEIGGSSEAVIPFTVGGSSEAVIPFTVGGSSEAVIPAEIGGSSEAVIPFTVVRSSEAVIPSAVGGSSEAVIPSAVGRSSEAVIPFAVVRSSEAVIPSAIGGSSEVMIPAEIVVSIATAIPAEIEGSSEAAIPSAVIVAPQAVIPSAVIVAPQIVIPAAVVASIEPAASSEGVVVPPPVRVSEKEAVPAALGASPRFENKEAELKKGMTLLGLLKKQGIGHNQSNAVAQSLKQVYSPRKMQAGQLVKMTLEMSEDDSSSLRLASLHFDINQTKTIAVNYDTAQGAYRSKIQERNLYQNIDRRVQASIQGSLYQTLKKHGMTPKAIQEVINLYAYDVDFQREIRENDKIDVLFAGKIDKDGELVDIDHLIFISLTVRGRKKTYYRYESPQTGKVGYYDENGLSIQKFLMKTPIEGARISSFYGMRRHPILGYSKMHTGVDFSARRGTPVYAAGSGRVLYVGRKGANGKYILLQHDNGYQTSYSHLSRYTRGLRKGTTVRQRQIIGYVGNTGRSTGSHLHYEVKHRGKSVNPMRLKFPTGGKLSSKEKGLFNNQRDAIIAQLATLSSDQSTQLASAAQ